MEQRQRDEALAALAAMVDAPHDDLADMSARFQSDDQPPIFWIDDNPVWHARTAAFKGQSNWPIVARRPGRVTIASLDGAHHYELLSEALQSEVDKVSTLALSETEFTLFSDLAAGLSLRDSAELAGVAIATRRKQLQSVFQKLSTSGQSELVSLASRLVHRLAVAIEAQGVGARRGGEDPYAAFLPKGMRYGHSGSGTGAAVRFFECGPVSGRPVFILHPMVFPYLDDADVALFEDLGWRAIWPIRDGCLGVRDQGLQTWNGHCNSTVEGLAQLHASVTDDPVPMISLVSSAAYAVKYAETHPGKVSRIDFVSTCFSSGRGTAESYFFDQMVNRLTRNGQIAVHALRYLTLAVGRKDQLEVTTRRVFGDCPADRRLLDEEFGSDFRRKRFRYAVLNSFDGMRHDYFSQLHFDWGRARQLEIPLQFIHGTEDRVNNLPQVERLSNHVARRPPLALPDLGHLTQGPEMRRVFRMLAAQYST